MKSSRLVCAIFRLKNKDSRKERPLGLGLNCYFYITCACCTTSYKITKINFTFFIKILKFMDARKKDLPRKAVC